MNAKTDFAARAAQCTDEDLRTFGKQAYTHYEHISWADTEAAEDAVAWLCALLTERGSRIEAERGERPTMLNLDDHTVSVLLADGTYDQPISNRSSAFDFPDEQNWHPRFLADLAEHEREAAADREAGVPAVRPLVHTLARIAAEQFPYGLVVLPSGAFRCRKTDTELDYNLNPDEADAMAALVNKYA